MGRSAALISQMDPPPGEETEFEAWYSEDHVPPRMEAPGFVSAVRGWAVQGEPSHLVIYHLGSREALTSPEYGEIKNNPGSRTEHMLANVAAFTRYIGEEIHDTGPSEPGRYLYLVTFGVPENFQVEFDAWYERDHLPHLMANEAWLRCRRYSVVDGEPTSVTRVAVHELSDLAVLDSPERARARETPWRARLSQNEWFASADYAVYERSQDFSATGV